MTFQDRRDTRRGQNHHQNDRYSEWSPGIPSNKLAIVNMPNDVDNAMVWISAIFRISLSFPKIIN